jgi:cytochrome b561
MLLKDTATGYGWVSIALHWITAVMIVVLLFLGNSISAQEPANRGQAVDLHTSIALASYGLLGARIVWRFVYGHPGPLLRQRGLFFLIGKLVHYITLIALILMLITGPLTAWFAGDSIAVFDWATIPSPFDANFAARDLAHRIHRLAAITIFIGILLHLGGVYKHTAFNQDGTLVKIILPGKHSESAGRGRDR